MNTLLIIILLLPVILAGVILIPRVRFSGEVGAELKRFCINNIWFSAEMDFQRKTSFLKILFFQIYSKDEMDGVIEDESFFTDDEYQEPETVGLDADREETSEEYTESVDNSHIEDIPPPLKRNKPSPTKARRSFKLKLKRKQKSKPDPDEQNIPWSLFLQERDLLLTIGRRMIGSMRRLFKTPRFDLLRIKLDIASPEPALTGAFYGAVVQLKAFEKMPQRQFIINPDFSRSMPSGELKMTVSISPLMMIIESLYLVLRLPWIRIFKVYRKWRKSEKEKDTDTVNISQE
ncbi:MAG: hypothetical protein HQ568_07750 [Calditrichaeota bacterium]|nr:hypothetical protein [Calditrichota bacterium]